MIDHTNLLNFINFFGKIKADHIRTNRVVFSIFDLYSFLRNIHPGAILAAEINDIKTLETIIFKLRMLGRQSYPLYLQSKTIKFYITRSKNLTLWMGGNENIAIFIEAIDASEHILERKLSNLSYVHFLLRNLEVILCYCVDFVLRSFC